MTDNGGVLCHVRDPDEIRRLKGIGFTDFAFMTGAEIDRTMKARSGVWVEEAAGAYWTYMEHEKEGVNARLHYSEKTYYFQDPTGWYLRASFFCPSDRKQWSTLHAVYQTAAEALAAFDKQLTEHILEYRRRVEACAQLEVEWAAARQRQSAEVRSALSGKGASTNATIPTARASGQTVETTAPAHLGRGFKNLLED